MLTIYVSGSLLHLWNNTKYIQCLQSKVTIHDEGLQQSKWIFLMLLLLLTVALLNLTAINRRSRLDLYFD